MSSVLWQFPRHCHVLRVGSFFSHPLPLRAPLAMPFAATFGALVPLSQILLGGMQKLRAMSKALHRNSLAYIGDAIQAGVGE
jgi:hypothetical protein